MYNEFKSNYKPMKLSDIFRFGKHKDELVSDVLNSDNQYLKFLISKGFEFEKETKDKILNTSPNKRYTCKKEEVYFSEFEEHEYEEDDEDFSDDFNYQDYMITFW